MVWFSFFLSLSLLPLLITSSPFFMTLFLLLTCLEGGGIGGHFKRIRGRGAAKGDDGLELAGLGCRGGRGEPSEGGDDGDDLEVLHFCGGFVLDWRGLMIPSVNGVRAKVRISRSVLDGLLMMLGRKRDGGQRCFYTPKYLRHSGDPA
jgi:hypothetical protein